MAKKVEIAIKVNPDNVEMMDKIVADYKIKDRSKAFRVLLDYVIDNETEWDNIFKRKRCKRCYWLRGKRPEVSLQLKAGLVKWYNESFVMISWEFDPLIQHHTYTSFARKERKLG